MKNILLPLLFLSQAFASSVPAVRSGIKPKQYAAPAQQKHRRGKRGTSHNITQCVTTPKLFIISMFDSEGNTWYDRPDINVLAKNITVPGFSPLFPDAHCTANGSVCQMTTGEGEINAAASIMALWTSGLFDLAKTYFLIAGIGGVNPHVATTGSVNFARFAVQFDLQYEFAQSQVPTNWTSGYVPQDAYYPDSTDSDNYPGEIYGTEAFELNENLKQRAVALTKNVTLSDSAAAQAYRDTYGYAPANLPPTVVECDSGTSNNYWSGSVLGDAFTAYTTLLTNGSGLYCNTQQEDSATLEALLRGNLAGKLDLARTIIMRTASDFDRAPPGETETFHLIYASQEGFAISIENLYVAGIEIVKDVLVNWDDVYDAGVKADNYVGDLFNSLNSTFAPSIGTEAIYLY